MKTHGLTDKGKEREYNEDSIGMLSLDCGITVLVVCDGMGGAVGGKTASELARDTFLSYIEEQISSLGTISKKEGAELLVQAIELANITVYNRAHENEELNGMGCTLCAIMYFEKEKKLISANVGDSRLYKITKNKIKQITKDHSYVQYLLDMGEIDEEEAEEHPQKNLITRAIGIEEAVFPDIRSVRVPRFAPTYFLLCSDGLCTMLSDEDIKEITLESNSLDKKVEKLINEANEAGGYDNISVLLLSQNREEADK